MPSPEAIQLIDELPCGVPRHVVQTAEQYASEFAPDSEVETAAVVYAALKAHDVPVRASEVADSADGDVSMKKVAAESMQVAAAADDTDAATNPSVEAFIRRFAGEFGLSDEVIQSAIWYHDHADTGAMSPPVEAAGCLYAAAREFEVAGITQGRVAEAADCTVNGFRPAWHACREVAEEHGYEIQPNAPETGGEFVHEQ